MEKLQADLQRDGEGYYSPRPPKYKTTLSIGLEDAKGPIPLDNIYNAFDEAYSQDPPKAQDFASTYGKLRVGTRLSAGPTIAEIKGLDEFDNYFAELSTSTPQGLDTVFSYPDIDSEVTYVLSMDESLTELQVIKALHMVDAALVTNLYKSGELPVIALADPDTIIRLRTENSGIMLRTYGNVRSIEGAPNILGLVMPTSALESSGVLLKQLPNATKKVTQSPQIEYLQVEELKQALIGITSAKRPHIGHAFLIAKALSVAKEVVVELNDRGPRVAAAVQSIANILGTSFEQAEGLITSGQIGLDQIEQAYRCRDVNCVPPELSSEFALTQPNAYYQTLLSQIDPKPGSIKTQSDSGLVVVLNDLSGYSELYDGSVSVISDDERSMIVKNAGVITVRGLYAALIKNLSSPVLVDSPPLFSKEELRILAQNGIKIETTEGSGLKLDFMVASGTKGDSLPIDECLTILADIDLPSHLLIPVVRKMISSTVLVKSSDGSFCPNFANIEIVRQRFEQEANCMKQQLNAGGNVELLAGVYEEIKLKSASRVFASSVISKLGFDTSKPPSKLDFMSVRTLLRYAPVLEGLISDKLANFLEANPDDQGSIRKDMPSDADRKLLLGIVSCNPESLLLLLIKQIEYDITRSTEYAYDLLKGTRLAETMTYMGYDTSNVEILKQLLGRVNDSDAKNRGVFVCK